MFFHLRQGKLIVEAHVTKEHVYLCYNGLYRETKKGKEIHFIIFCWFIEFVHYAEAEWALLFVDFLFLVWRECLIQTFFLYL